MSDIMRGDEMEETRDRYQRVRRRRKQASELAAPACSALEKSVESAHRLAMLALQSERYSADHEYRNAVDAVLSWSLPAWTAKCKAPVQCSDLLCRDRDTLARWWCELNVFEWPNDFPMQKPSKWDEMTDRERMQAGKPAWEAISAAIPYPGALEYWRKIFLPKRHNAAGEQPRKENHE